MICKGAHKMKMQIYYFSGTGNSLYIAREIHKRFPTSNLVPIINVLNSNKIEVNGDSVGFIFPVHAFTMPIPVKELLEKVTFNSTTYFFAVATRGGSPCNVFKDIDNMLKKKGKQLDSHFFVDMPNNFTHVAETPTKENIIELNSQAIKKLDTIEKIIKNKKKYQEKILNKSLLRKKILFPILSRYLHKSRYMHTDKKFYVESNCTGCGLCSKICLSNKIEFNGNKPHWIDETACLFCFACLNYCPHKAIQIRGSKSVVKGRYQHPDVTSNDISMQKSSYLSDI